MNEDQDFGRMARAHGEGNFVRELWQLISQRKKYWMIPIVAVLLAFGLLVVLSGTAAAPFIYTLF